MRFEGNSFDTVVSSGSSGGWKNPVKALNECYTVLKRDGEAWIIDFHKDLSKEEMEILQREMDERGFSWLANFSPKSYIKGCAYSTNEISEIVKKTMFEDCKIENYEFLNKDVLANVVFKKHMV